MTNQADWMLNFCKGNRIIIINNKSENIKIKINKLSKGETRLTN